MHLESGLVGKVLCPHRAQMYKVSRPPRPIITLKLPVIRQKIEYPQYQYLHYELDLGCSDKILAMTVSLRHLLGWIVSAFSSREDLILENLALRQQLLTLHATRPRRRLSALHKLFWVAFRRFWSGWTKPLVLVTPRTVVSWHRAGFRLYWTWVSRARRVEIG